MLALEGVTVRQGSFSLTLDLVLAQGARLALLGASGSGKSTLLSLIAGFTVPDSGQVRIAGKDVSHAPVKDRPMAILFQDGNLFPHLSVADNVGLGISPRLALSETDQDRVVDALARVGLPGFEARRPADLSGGQQSRAALARVLVQNKPLVLLDEPFAALDPGLRRDMLALMQELAEAKGLTLVMASHDLRDASRLCDQLCVLEDGRVVVQGAMSDILAAPPEPLAPWL